MNKVAVVILNWNGWEMLHSFLPSVVCYSQVEGAVVYVVDNGSTDQSVVLLQQEFPTVRLIQLEKNYGFAQGYNRALQQIEATYFVLLNSDVEVTKGWLSPLINYLDTHPTVAGCQPKVLNQREKKRFEYAGAAGGFLDCYGYPFCRGRIMNVLEEDQTQYDSIIPIFWMTGAACCIRSTDYWSAGGLDGDFFAHMEEIDLCWRLRARGHQLVCIPQSVVYHVGGATLKKENPQKTFFNFRNSLLMLYKNLPQAELRSVLRMRALLDLVATIYFLLKGEFPHAWAVLRARRAFHKLRPSFAAVRAENLQKTTQTLIPERISQSILGLYYIRRKKHFSQIRSAIQPK